MVNYVKINDWSKDIKRSIQQQTLDQLHNMEMKQINTTHLHNVKGFFEKLKAWIENSTILLW
jgi:hypothetical protein